jgi:hypothetical protein
LNETKTKNNLFYHHFFLFLLLHLFFRILKKLSSFTQKNKRMSNASAKKKGGRRAQAKELAKEHPDIEALRAASNRDFQLIYSFALCRLKETDPYTMRLKGYIITMLINAGITTPQSTVLLAYKNAHRQDELGEKINAFIEVILHTDWKVRVKEIPPRILTLMMYWNAVLMKLYQRPPTDVLIKVKERVQSNLVELGLLVGEIHCLSRYCSIVPANPEEFEKQVNDALERLIQDVETGVTDEQRLNKALKEFAALRMGAKSNNSVTSDSDTTTTIAMSADNKNETT